MPLFEVWEYGEGDSPRNTYQAPSEEQAITAFLDRLLISGKTYRDHLQEQDIDRILVCVKNPAHKGTLQNPNYPSVYDIDLTQTALGASLGQESTG